MTKCSKCGEFFPEDGFYSNGRGGLRKDCKECVKRRQKERRKLIPPPKRPRKIRKDSFRLLPEGMRKCTRCVKIMPKEMFYKQAERLSGVTSHCKECTKESQKRRRLERGEDWIRVRRAWEFENAEILREKRREYAFKNRDRRNLIEARRTARKRSLPDTMTKEEMDEVVATYHGNCVICGDPYEHLDHFIPIATGRGGTTRENIVPMCSTCNLSKNSSNPFKWSQRLEEFKRERFYYLIAYLSQVNEMSIREYEEHVYSCFEK